jgi:Multiubiquitin
VESVATHTKFEIFIDHHKFEVTQAIMTGAELRQLPSPPIGPDRDLYLEQPGGEDQLIGLQYQIKIKDGQHFFTVPTTINPGA